MAEIEYYIGNHGPYFTDDTSTEYLDDGQLVQRRELSSATTGVGMLTETGSQTVSNKTFDNSNKYGGASNYTMFEADGTLKMVGDATVYDDINTGINPRNTGVGRPNLVTFLGNLLEFQFAVNDFADLQPIELLHDWEEGSTIEFHCHWATGGLNDTTVRGVKWEIEYSWANMQAAGGTIVFTTPVAISAETSIAANEAAYTHKYTSVGTLTPTGGKIGAQICFRVKRIASVTNTAPVADPFLLSVGVHYKRDTLGSRTTSGK